MSAPRPRPASLVVAVAAGGIVGAVLRLYRLTQQVLVEDELHAVRAVLALRLDELLTTFGAADHSLPLAALFKLRVASAPLTESFLRLPGLVAGVALLLLPLAARRWLGWGWAATVCWLLALSPGLVLYSRIARPYMPVVAFGTLAAFAFHAWWRGGRPALGVVYVLASSLAFWFFLGALPFVAAPLGWALLRKWWRAAEGPHLAALAAVAAGLALGVAAVLGPAADSFGELLRTKRGVSRPDLPAIWAVLELQAGTNAAAPAAAFWLAAAGGLALLARRQPILAQLTACMVFAQWFGIWWLAPFGLGDPVVCNRYLLVGLPLVLCWVAVALTAVGGRVAAVTVRLRAGRLPQVAAGSALAALLALLFMAGPLADPQYHHSSFLHGHDFLSFYRAPGTFPAAAVPRFYWRLRAAPGDGAVVELSELPTWVRHDHVAIYQRIHQRRVLLAPAEDSLFGPDLAFTNFVEPAPSALLASEARWAILHRLPVREVDLVRLAEAPTRPETPLGLRQITRAVARHRGDELAAAWGPPDFTDRLVWAWDLDSVRRRLTRRAPPG